MIEQVIGGGANTFILIVAVLMGFAAALGAIDFRKNKREERQRNR